jgi:hypothetical protein
MTTCRTKLIRALFAVAFLCTGCGKIPPWPQSGVFRGEYTIGFETSSFKPCGVDERWWVRGNAEALVAAAMPAGIEPQKLRYYQGSVYADVRARVSRRGRYGHLGFYDREMNVVKVIRTSNSPLRGC